MPTSQNKLDRANDAKRLMSDPTLIRFLEAAEDQLFQRWRQTAFASVEDREKLNLQQVGLEAFKEFMHKTLVDGQMVARDLEER